MAELDDGDAQSSINESDMRLRELERALTDLALSVRQQAGEYEAILDLKNQWQHRAARWEQRGEQLERELAALMGTCADLIARSQVLDAIVGRQEVLGPYAHDLSGSYENSLRALRAHDDGRQVSLDPATGRWTVTAQEGIDLSKDVPDA